MEFWLTAALLTFAATLTVLLPLTRNKQEFCPLKNDLEVYRDQLREVEADAARGMIDAPSAEQARIEISRRILGAEKSSADAAAEVKRFAQDGCWLLQLCWRFPLSPGVSIHFWRARYAVHATCCTLG